MLLCARSQHIESPLLREHRSRHRAGGCPEPALARRRAMDEALRAGGGVAEISASARQQNFRRCLFSSRLEVS
jgi:hypothetical protein